MGDGSAREACFVRCVCAMCVGDMRVSCACAGCGGDGCVFVQVGIWQASGMRQVGIAQVSAGVG